MPTWHIMFITVKINTHTHLAHRHHHRIIRHVQFDAIVKIVRQLNVWLATVECCRDHFWYLSVVQRSLHRGTYSVE